MAQQMVSKPPCCHEREHSQARDVCQYGPPERVGKLTFEDEVSGPRECVSSRDSEQNRADG
jgi:hypothetical protein